MTRYAFYPVVLRYPANLLFPAIDDLDNLHQLDIIPVGNLVFRQRQSLLAYGAVAFNGRSSIPDKLPMRGIGEFRMIK
jgi:hypothetical protein